MLRRIPVDPGFDPVLTGVDGGAFPQLGVIDPYGDTAFNYLQVRNLVEELSRYQQISEVPASFFEDLRELCELVLAGTHRFLWFAGE